MKTLQDALRAQTFTKNLLLKLLGLVPHGQKLTASTSRASMEQLLHDTLMGPKLAQVVASLQELERVALAYLVHHGWTELDLGHLALSQGQGLDLGPNPYGPAYQQGADPRPLSALWTLLYPAAPDPQRGNISMVAWGVMNPGRYLALPKDLAAKLAPLLDPVPEPALEPLPEAPVGRRIERPRGRPRFADLPIERYDQSPHVALELERLLKLAAQRKITITPKTQRLTTPSMRLLTGQLASPSPLHDPASWLPLLTLIDAEHQVQGYIERAQTWRIRCWLMLLLKVGVLESSPRHMSLTPFGMELSTLPTPSALAKIWRRWLDSEEGDELFFLIGLSSFAAEPSPVTERRAQLSQLLGMMTPGSWYKLNDLLGVLAHRGELRSCFKDALGVFVHTLDGQLQPLRAHMGLILDLNYLKTLLVEIAATLGLVEVALLPPLSLLIEDDAMSPYESIEALRLTELGAQVLAASAQSHALVYGQLHAQPDLSLVATGPLPANALAMLDTWTTSTGPMTWQLERKVALRACERGEDPRALRDTLQAVTSQEALPSTILAFLDDLERRHMMLGPARVHHVIQLQEAHAALELAHDKQLKDHVQLIQPDTLLIPHAQLDLFYRVARRHGYVVRP